MPVQFQGILAEHNAVRNAAGLFDISHMGQVRLTGPDATGWLDRLLTNNTARLLPGKSQYTLMTNTNGGVIDDLIVYKTGSEYFLVLNAAVLDKDLEWMRSRLSPGIELIDESDATAGFALQGPSAGGVFKRCFNRDIVPRREYVEFEWQGHRIVACGTGYTGEAGCEIFCPVPSSCQLYETLLSAGETFGLAPCGLGARDTLRLEMAYPLNGNDLSPERTPIEAGLGAFVSANKSGDYPGRAIIEAQRNEGPSVLLAALLLDPGAPPPRPHYAIFHDDQPVGELSSGALSPTLGRGIGLAYLPAALAERGIRVEIEIRGRRFPATTHKKPFYNPNSQ